LLCCHGLGEHTLLGTALDDAIGESFDKGARLLGINSGLSEIDLISRGTLGEVVGGMAVERFARAGDATRFQGRLPVPMLKHNTCDFSYAGQSLVPAATLPLTQRRVQERLPAPGGGGT
jgi:N6-L-threonylcarbamoyladenine synthase